MRTRIKSAQPRKNRRCRFAIELLIDDCFREDDEDAGRAADLHAERTDGVDETAQRRIGIAQIIEREGRIER